MIQEIAMLPKDIHRIAGVYGNSSALALNQLKPYMNAGVTPIDPSLAQPFQQLGSLIQKNICS
jgi:hypothetical protein